MQDRDKDTGKFVIGKSGNPSGRPKGSRNKLNEQFLADFYVVWEEHGAAALQRTAVEEPATFVRVAASLLPKEMRVEQSTSDLTEEQIDERIARLAAELGLVISDGGSKEEEAGAAEPKAVTH